MPVFGVFLIRIFPAFGLNTESYRVSLHIQFECGKIRTRKTPETDTFQAVKETLKADRNQDLNSLCKTAAFNILKTVNEKKKTLEELNKLSINKQLNIENDLEYINCFFKVIFRAFFMDSLHF